MQIENHPFALSLSKSESLSCFDSLSTNGKVKLTIVLQESIKHRQGSDYSPFSYRQQRNPRQIMRSFGESTFRSIRSIFRPDAA